MVWLVVLEHGKDDTQHLVGQCHDGFLVPLANAQGSELVFQGAATSTGSLGKLTQQAPDPCIAFAGFAALALSRTLVVARTDAKSRSQLLGAAKAVHVGTDLHQQHGRTHLIDTGNGLQQRQLRLPGRQALQQRLLEAAHAGLQFFDVRHDLGQHE